MLEELLEKRHGEVMEELNQLRTQANELVSELETANVCLKIRKQEFQEVQQERAREKAELLGRIEELQRNNKLEEKTKDGGDSATQQQLLQQDNSKDIVIQELQLKLKRQTKQMENTEAALTLMGKRVDALRSENSKDSKRIKELQEMLELQNKSQQDEQRKFKKDLEKESEQKQDEINLKVKLANAERLNLQLQQESDLIKKEALEARREKANLEAHQQQLDEQKRLLKNFEKDLDNERNLLRKVSKTMNERLQLQLQLLEIAPEGVHALEGKLKIKSEWLEAKRKWDFLTEKMNAKTKELHLLQKDLINLK